MPSLKLAVVLFDRVNFLDFLGPVEQLGFLQQPRPSTDIETDRVTVSIEYLGPTRDPIKPDRGPAVLVDRAYDEVGEDERFDILLVPGGTLRYAPYCTTTRLWQYMHQWFCYYYISSINQLYCNFSKGMGTRPNIRPPSVIDFIRRQAQCAKYILSVCTGSWLLADAGVLDGKRATSNKAAFRNVKVSLPAYLPTGDMATSALV